MGGKATAVNLTPRSIDRLKGVHPDLVRVVFRAASLISADPGFVVIEGVRTKARQIVLFKSGASSTMQSRHLTGHAVDIAAIVGASVRWDWPLYPKLAAVFKEAARAEDVPIIWGGDWPRLRDGPHFELPRSKYP